MHFIIIISSYEAASPLRYFQVLLVPIKNHHYIPWSRKVEKQVYKNIMGSCLPEIMLRRCAIISITSLLRYQKLFLSNGIRGEKGKVKVIGTWSHYHHITRSFSLYKKKTFWMSFRFIYSVHFLALSLPVMLHKKA